ncbi:RDD family protein [Flexivirga sp. ID2601S]|uniref:RDD family protein n=1 Tax=Flexivirga aerilata TaxID=1656889 RepID=A0A849ALD9_9MICO|nr:RDD family protein [Flexivirga aerilata]
MTGEAVLIDVPSAPLPTRVVGAVIDWAVYVLLFVGLILLLSLASGGASDATFSTLVLLSMVLCLLVIPVTVETLTRGRSLGKLIMKLRVVRDDGGPIVFRHAFVRGLLAVVEIWTLQGIPALVAAASNARSKRLGDLAAGTYVVREQTGMKLVPPPQPPPYLRAWAQSADIAPLPDGVALAVRQFLIRRWTLSPAARATLTDSLLGQVQPLVSPPPPPHTNPEDFLSAVLAERSARDGVKLRRDNGIRARLLPPDAL